MDESYSDGTACQQESAAPESGQPTLIDVPPDQSRAAQVAEVFSEWQRVTGHVGARLDKARRSQIERGLRGYGLTGALMAVRGVGRSAFHMGENDAGKRYDSLELIFRNADKTEAFIALELQSERTPKPTFREIDDACMRFYCSFIEHMQTRYHTARPLSDSMRDAMRDWLPELVPPQEYVAAPDFYGLVVPFWPLSFCKTFDHCAVLCLLSIKCVNRWAGRYVAKKVIDIYGKSNPDVARERAEWWEQDCRADFAACYSASVQRMRNEFLQSDPFGGTTDSERRAHP